MRSISLLNIRIDDLSVDALVEEISEFVRQGRKSIVANVNIHAMNLAYQSESLREFFNNCAIVFCDGFGVVLGARIAGAKLNHRYTPPDWIPLLCEACIENEMSLYFLGARQGVGEKAANVLRSQFPGLDIAGIHHGYFDKTLDSKENQEVLKYINKLRPDILLVGFGMPDQEIWLRDNWPQIDTIVALPVGAFFDYIAGDIPRAPTWITSHGFEWLGRLIVEPKRLWKRYIIGNPLFILRVIKKRFA